MPKDTGIGAAIKRREDARFLLGSGRDSDDITLLNQAHAIFVRSEVANGEIDSIDTSEAEASVVALRSANHNVTHIDMPLTPERVWAAMNN